MAKLTIMENILISLRLKFTRILIFDWFYTCENRFCIFLEALNVFKVLRQLRPKSFWQQQDKETTQESESSQYEVWQLLECCLTNVRHQGSNHGAQSSHHVAGP